MKSCSNCRTYNPEEANFCQKCGQALVKICDKCGTENDSVANFCMHCGQQLAEPVSAGTLVADTPAKPPEETKAERRIVTVLFCDVVGSTSMSEQLDPETWTEIMNGVFERTIAAVRRYDGTVDRMLGDAIMAIFGAPIAYEDDPYRAVLAGLRIIQELRPYQDTIRHDLAKDGVRIGADDFEVRVGINTGLVVVSNVGAGRTRKWTPLGDTVNLAARMENAAKPGTILITDNTFRMVAPFIEAEDLGSQKVKGKRDDVRAFRVLGLKEKQSPEVDLGKLESPLIARERELHMLQEAVRNLREGKGQILCLIGEAGLGKSRLVKELKTSSLDLPMDDELVSEKVAWYESESLSFEVSQPYGLFRKLLRQMTGLKRSDGPELIQPKISWLAETMPSEKRSGIRRSFETLFGLSGEKGRSSLRGEEFKPQLFESITTLFRTWASASPTVLVFEDLHWADPASVELIQELFSLIDEVPLLLLCVFRPDGQSPAGRMMQQVERDRPDSYQVIQMDPLTVTESSMLVSKLLDLPGLPEKLLRLILEKAEGIPIFIEEIVRELIESQALSLSENGRDWTLSQDFEKVAVPDSLESVLVARMDRLEEGARHTLQLASVIGRSFHYRVLKMIAAIDARLDLQLRSLEQAGMIEEITRLPDREYMFKHVLTQEAAYNTILLKERRLYHQRVGEIMEQLFADQIHEQAPLLANHFHQAGNHEQALTYYAMAAESARRLFANEEAIRHYIMAIQLSQRVEINQTKLIALYRGRGRVYETVGNFAAARDDFTATLRLAESDPNPRAMSQAQLDLGKLWASRDYEKTAMYYDQALEMARKAGDRMLLARILNRIGNWHNNAENPEEAEKFHQEALEIFEELGDKRGVATTLDLLAVVNTFRGNSVLANNCYELAIAHFEEIDDLPGLSSCMATRSNFRIPCLCSFSDTKKENNLVVGIEDSKSAIKLASKIGRRSDESFADWSLALLYAAQGKYGLALEAAQDGLQIASEIGHSQCIVAHQLGLGHIYCDLLCPEKAWACCEEMLILAKEIGSSNWINHASGIMARAFIMMDELERADEYLISMRSDELTMNTVSRRYRWCRRAELSFARGDANTGLEILDRIIASVEELMAGFRNSEIWRLRGKALVAVGRLKEAEATLLAGQDHAQRIGERSQLWRIKAELGHLYTEMGCDNEAEAASKAASELIENLAKTIPDEAIRDRFVRRASQRCV